MKGKVLLFITAILFGATVVASPIMGTAQAAQHEKKAAGEVAKPAKKAKKAAKKKATKKKAEKKKKATKKKAKKVEEKA